MKSTIAILAVSGLAFAAGCSGEAPVESEMAHADAVVDTGELLEKTDDTGHPLRQVAAEGAPQVAIEVNTDTMGGWNLQLATENWDWAPEAAGGEVAANAGHAHLFVNGEKLTRVYGDWFYLGKNAAEVGDEVSVSLNANDHSTWAVAGNPITVRTTIEEAAEGMADHSSHDGHGSHDEHSDGGHDSDDSHDGHGDASDHSDHS